MEAQHDWEKLVTRIERLMRLKSFPVAFKMLEKKEQLEQIPFMRLIPTDFARGDRTDV